MTPVNIFLEMNENALHQLAYQWQFCYDPDSQVWDNHTGKRQCDSFYDILLPQLVNQYKTAIVPELPFPLVNTHNAVPSTLIHLIICNWFSAEKKHFFPLRGVDDRNSLAALEFEHYICPTTA